MAVRLPVEPNENLDQIIARLKNYHSQDVVLVLPTDTRVLQELNNFYTLRSAVRAENINLSIAGGNKTIRGLANLLGFSIERESATAPKNEGGSGFSNQGTVVRPNFSGVPEGYVVATPPTPAPGGPGMPNPGGQDFFNDMQDFNPVPTAPPLQTPSTNRLPRIQNFAADQTGSRPNLPGSFNPKLDESPGLTGRQPRPQPGFNLVGSENPNRNHTLSYDEASRSGLFSESDLGSLGASYQPAGLDETPLDEDYDQLPDFENENDNAAGQFRTRKGGYSAAQPLNPGLFGNRRSDRPVPETDEIEFVDDDIEQVAGRPSAANSTKDWIKRLLMPVQHGGGPRMASPSLTPERQQARQADRQRTTTITILGVLFALLLVVLLLILLLKPGGVINQGPVIQTLTVPLKTDVRTQTVRLALVPGGVGAAPTALAATVPAGASTTTGAVGTAGATKAAAATPAPPATLPVELVNTGEIKKTGEHAATGIRKVADKPASGPAVFYNRSFNPKSYGAGAVIYTRNGVTYRLVRAITINGSAAFNGQAGQATGEVVADKAGTIGNIAEVASFPLNENVGVGLGPLTNGTDRDEKFITQPDLDDLKKQLRDQALSEVNNALKYDQTTMGVLVLKSGEPVCDFPKKVNEVAESFTGTCTTSLEAAKYRTDAVTRGAAAQMGADPAYRLDEKSNLEFTSDPKLVEEKGTRYMEVQVRGRVIRELDANAFKAAVAGKTKAEVSTLVAANFPQVDLNLLDLKAIPGDTLPSANLLEIKKLLDYEAAAQSALTPSSGPKTPGANSNTVPVVSAPPGTPKS
jgi:hypothetical protein